MVHLLLALIHFGKIINAAVGPLVMNSPNRENLSIMNLFQLNLTLEYSSLNKEKYPNIFIIWGGPTVGMNNQKVC